MPTSLGKFSLLATSTAASTVSTSIPTAFAVIGSSFFKKYWWLRSPTTSYGNEVAAYLITLSGVLDFTFGNNIGSSYGHICSLGTNGIYYGSWVDPSGFSNGGYGSVSSSYGNRRARVGTIMRVAFIRLAASTATTSAAAMSTVPTGV